MRLNGQNRVRIGETQSVADPETQAYQQQLEQFFGTKVKLERRGASGKIEIEFYSPDDLRGIVQKLAAVESPLPIVAPADVPQEEFPV